MLAPPNRYKLSSMNHCRCKPLPPLSPPVNPAKPCNCPPRVYRNPPDVIVAPGENVSVDESHDDAQVKYTVNAHIPAKEPVKVDPEIMYGDGINEPLGVYDYDGETAGLVPDAPDSDTDKKFLRADGQWGTITIPEQVQSDWAQTDDTAPDFIKNKVTNFRGATANDDGTSGLVPAPAIADADKYLKGDGTWATITIPVVADMTGATEQANGAHGLVPQPLIADREKFLKGDGTWANVDNTSACTVAEMDGWLDAVDNEGNNNG